MIGIHTIYRSQGIIPERFLRGAGIPDEFVAYMKSLVGTTIEFYSCFISYSSKDDAFARRLYADLQSHNVRCWFAPEDLKWGDRIRTGSEAFFRIDPFKVRRSCSRQLPSNTEAAPGLLSTVFCLAVPPS